MTAMPTRRLGDLEVSAVGMGGMTLTQTVGTDQERAVTAVHAALDAGVTLFDTADAYGPTSELGVNERALVAALRSSPADLDRVVIATKGGHTRSDNATWWIDGSPDHLAAAARDSLVRLGLDALPLYQLHRPDPRVPFADSMGAMRQLVDDGIARRIGVSNVSEEQLEVAITIVGDSLVSVQNEYAALARESEPVLRRCEQLGLAFLAWGPLGGRLAAKQLGDDASVFGEVARAHGVSPQRVAIAWVLSASPVLIPIPGASRPESILDSVAAVSLELTDDERRALAAQAS